MECLKRAGLAHPALRGMAAEVERGLTRFSAVLTRALGRLRERAALDEGAAPILGVGPDLVLPPSEPPGWDLGLEL